jgi:FKBP-type peptidyl-prolyl cis-trans isomerase FkpA
MLRKVILSAILAVTAVGIFAQGGNVDTSKPTAVTGKPKKTSSGVSYWDIQEGTGATAKKGQTVTVNYTGWLTNGKKFDSSVGKTPLQFTLLSGVIQGWIDGIQGMKVGGKRQLKIPPELGYGSRGVGNGIIPPNATLIFDVELLSIDSK